MHFLANAHLIKKVFLKNENFLKFILKSIFKKSNHYIKSK